MASFEPSPLDEGYSEAPLVVGNAAESAKMPLWLARMPIQDRTDYVMSIMNGLPTSEVCDIVRRLRPRLYMNFFQHLPPEVCLKILGFLDPVSLMNTARASREWMLLAFDRKLWEHLYHLEGFRVIQPEVVRFEATLSAQSSTNTRAPQLQRRSQQPPVTLQGDGDSEMMDADCAPVVRQESIFGPVGNRNNDVRPTVGIASGTSSSAENRADEIMPDARDSQRFSEMPSELRNLTAGPSSSPTATSSSLVVLDRSNRQPKLNWQYLYAQRRRLEANWQAEKYTNFQLPHPNHPEERHRECIYTIQHSGKYLVSGSRDKTLRIWDLDTQRLVHPPLTAHTGSVLCLQFDADPEEDLIVSGSSDATICLWRFSTGKLIQRMKRAHGESVLNVRFDKRFLVTCSKDKTIKIFNRQPLMAGDHGYPDMADALNSVPTYLNNYGFNPAPTAGLPVKQPYSIIAILEGHGAAVNAVQIHGNEVVSASGDRTIKVWNWTEQTCTRTLIGHTKGIACVQYDGRRIVSGSSDNEVKVFDKDSGLEVASLRAHSDLVRTVQAGFGDLPYSATEDKEDAKAIDNEYFRAIDAGQVSRTISLSKGRGRNAGSRKPEDITAYGAKLPPGGGGGKFGRIVSGSYDGSIIIWRRDKEGVWKPLHTLRQEEGVVAARNASLRRVAAPPVNIPNLSTNTTPATHANNGALQGTSTHPSTHTNHPPQQTQTSAPSTSTSTSANAPTIPFAVGSSAFYHHLIDLTLPQGPAALRQALQSYPQLVQHPYLQSAIAALPVSPQRSQLSVIIAAASSAQIQAASVTQPTGHTAAQASQAPQAPQGTAPVQQNPTPVAPPPAPHHPHHAHRQQAEIYRVFKLQFDARRIISCSQTPIIVGWDFANGDQQIIEASRFFAPIE